MCVKRSKARPSCATEVATLAIQPVVRKAPAASQRRTQWLTLMGAISGYQHAARQRLATLQLTST